MRGFWLNGIVIICISVIFLSFNSCSSSTGPEDNTPAGRRDYTWTVDTLNKISSYNRYILLYGTSPTNIWCLGEGVFSTSFIHYDGKSWKFVDYHNQGCGVDPFAVHGLYPNDFWIGGADNMIWRCTDENIYKFGVYPIENFGRAFIQGFCGSTSNDIYACGSVFTKKEDSVFCFLMHYDGINWKYITKPEIPGYFMRMVKTNESNSDIYLYNLKRARGVLDTLSIYKYNGKTCERIYSKPLSFDNAVGFMNFGNKIYFGMNKRIYTYQDNAFVQCIDLSQFNILELEKNAGRSLKDFFLKMVDGIGHYNGKDIEIVYKCDSDAVIRSSLVLEKDVYFLIDEFDTNYNLLVHGKLKE